MVYLCIAFCYSHSPKCHLIFLVKLKRIQLLKVGQGEGVYATGAICVSSRLHKVQNFRGFVERKFWSTDFNKVIIILGDKM
jgi:hypothetical protein